ncbi:hypothetical protein CYFUS_005501 [Cystobacter fuscus]|uniref:Uncharacterized protein n=1 Tax=Cystobacter fuscus TaxID=43 RepID=A0A250J8Y9_9BACT|nr:hypothetical protein [Cystobacter fuscus]ATB40053.1 hypothetical protein CYFUS_005501 [Cystobacter fuscus]
MARRTPDHRRVCHAAPAGGSPVPRGGGGASVVPRPAPRGVVADVFGGEEPRDVVAREAAEALRARGFSVLGVETVEGLAPTVEEAARLARERQADATVVLVLTRLDLSALQPLGQVQVTLESLMVGPTGQVWTSGERRATTAERLYQSRTNWRSHVRQAVIQSVRELP